MPTASVRSVYFCKFSSLLFAEFISRVAHCLTVIIFSPFGNSSMYMCKTQMIDFNPQVIVCIYSFSRMPAQDSIMDLLLVMMSEWQKDCTSEVSKRRGQERERSRKELIGNTHTSAFEATMNRLALCQYSTYCLKIIMTVSKL